jgi:two-component system LytT family sensor kinase
MLKAPLGWGLVVCGWALLALVSSTQFYVVQGQLGHPVPWRWAVRLPILQYAFWAAATPLVIWLARRFPLRGWNDIRHAAVHAGAALGLFFVYSVYRVPFHSFVYPQSYFPRPSTGELIRLYVVGNMVENFSLYAALLAAGLALEYFGRYQSREMVAMSLKAELAEARLQTLRMQLQPDFLFIALNTIASFIP